MAEYFVTFGSQYTPRNERHPNYDKAHRDGWVTIVADSYDQARDEVVRRLGVRWSMLYGADGFEPEYFPLGELDRWDAAAPPPSSQDYPCWQVRELSEKARDAGALDVYVDAAHAVHPRHLHTEQGRLLTCLGYVPTGGPL